ncbi:MAG: phospho-N-acetylmuramoyl-pentapeptide-transferase [Candidatus Doudnabacteria bacterium]|nr:phospho-N-acetylmuramoyl-pentapeptide-transferase [Candidatus Doudnabacteria bacterium]
MALTFALTVLSFLVAMLATPILTHFLFKYKLSKKLRAHTWDGQPASAFLKIHKGKEGTPTMGGVLVWVTVAIVTVLFNLSRSQTWLPLFALVASGGLGLIDDLLNVRGTSIARGLSVKLKFIFQFLIAGLGAWWFYEKLEFSVIRLPAAGVFGWPVTLDIGWLYVPLFILTVIFLTNAVNITDGLDGLAGGTLAASFGAILGIAIVQGQFGIAAIAGTFEGALLAILWFIIYPARFFMGDTGAFALGATLAVLAFLTNTVVLLPVIAFIFVIEALSSILQWASKRLFGRRIFRIAPLHHHFEALGWPEAKVTMRFWVIAAVMAAIGMALALI